MGTPRTRAALALPDEGGRGEKVPVCLHWPGNVCFTSRSVLQVHPVGVLSKEVRRRLRPLHGTFEAAATMYRLRFGVEVGDGEVVQRVLALAVAGLFLIWIEGNSR